MKVEYDNKKFPIKYNGKLYYEKDCHEYFLSIYGSKEELSACNGLYIANDNMIYPDGEIKIDKDDV